MAVTFEMTCPRCGHAADVSVAGSASDADIPALKRDVYVCEECHARFMNGRFQPRIVTEPFVDDDGVLFIRIRVQDPSTKEDALVLDLDPQMAASQAKALLSLAVP